MTVLINRVLTQFVYNKITQIKELDMGLLDFVCKWPKSSGLFFGGVVNSAILIVGESSKIANYFSL